MASLVGPDASEILVLLTDPVGITPGGKDVQALPVTGPSRLGLIERTIEGETITSLVLNDTGFFMEKPVRRERLPPLITRHGNADFEMSVGHHPGEEFECLGHSRITRLQRRTAQMLLNFLL
ncbi:hypothetical protein [Microvirga sp. VF16]|uniref:hypothetical protein n=1 Tax=Microvirga sp. VF16 TaxID=2807101 RepID=UPI00352FF8F9